ncbi:MAG: hypothetical protein ACHQKY_13105 [Terriglobia bacterium]
MSNTALQASMVLFLAGDPAWLPSGLTRSVGGESKGRKIFTGTDTACEANLVPSKGSPFLIYI